MKLVNLLNRIIRRHPRKDLPIGAFVDPSSYLNPSSIIFRPGCTLRVGAGSHVNALICFDREGAHIEIGERCYISSPLYCANRISIGNDVMISGGGAIFDHDSHSMEFAKRADDVRAWRGDEKDWTHVPMRPVRIDDKAWIGYGVIVLKGVTVGEGAIIGAGSVTTRSVEQWTLVAGNPARPIRKLSGR